MKFDVFSPKSPPVIGVDIADSSVKMVEFSRGKNGLCLERFAIESFADGVVEDNAIVNAEALSKAIKACHLKMGSKIKGVATCLPGAMIITKSFNAPAGMTVREMEEQVSSEMANAISFDIAEASVDFHVDDEKTRILGTDEVVVTACAALSLRVLERTDAIEAAGLKPLIVDSEFLALIDVAQQFMSRTDIAYQDANVMIVDLGLHTTHFTCLRNGEVIFTREQAFGGHQIAAEIEQKLGVSAAESKKIKTGQVTASDEEQSLQIRKDFNEAAGNEVKRAIQLFSTSTDQTTVEVVLMCGSGVAVPGIEEVVGEIVGTQTHRLRPFAGLKIAPGLDSEFLKRECVSLVVASGLALRRFDK